MDIRVLKYFLAVAREQSFSTAAERLFLSQPTLSRQLKDLEEEFDKQLLIREPRRILLTDDGELLRRRAEEILSLVEKTEGELLSSNEDISGDIRIGAGESVHFGLIMAAARQLAESAGSAEEKAVAWQETQKKWLLALNTMYDKWYLSADKSLRDTIAADRLSFDELVDARRNTLADLYPEDPAAAEEALANMIMERTELICGLLHTAGILTDAP